MSYISAIAIDFGSSNTGADRISHFEKGELTFSDPTPIFSDGRYAKDSTWFYIEPSLLERAFRDYSSLADTDFKILSRGSTKTLNPNVIWGRLFIDKFDGYIKQNHWVGFKYFKMMIYRNQDYSVGGKTYPIGFVVKLFLRIIKIDCLNVESSNAKRNVTSDEVQWGVTIPSIWTDNNKRMMSNICEEVFGKHVRVLSEPEGPVVAERLHEGTGSFKSKPGYKSFVIDAGGGTTDLCLVEDEKSSNGGPQFKLLASSDGIGLGGNNIDDAFYTYFVNAITDGLSNPQGRSYNSMSAEEKKKELLEPYLKTDRNLISFEDAWLNFKHGVTSEYQIPKSYLGWLKTVGNKEVVQRVTDILIGCDDTESFAPDVINEKLFVPVYKEIAECVNKFIDNNRQEFVDSKNFSVVFAGGFSLAKGFRSYIFEKISLNLSIMNVNLVVRDDQLDIMSNLSIYNASEAVMEGAAYILLNRSSMKRRAKQYIFDLYSFKGKNMGDIRDCYLEIGHLMKLGELDSIAERDLESGASRNSWGRPVAIKGEYYTDYTSDFNALDENQKEILNLMMASDEIVVFPLENPLARKICEFSIPNEKGKSFKCTIDFNESEIGLNMHCYITSKADGDVVFEENFPLK